MSENTPRIGSMFSGYGGLDLAAEQYFAAETVWHCETDKHAQKVLARRWPGVPNLGDVAAIDWANVEPADVLTSGFPCQDLSYAGRGRGIKEGTRSGLWTHVMDAMRVLRPRLTVLENVSAIVTRRPGLDVVLADLARNGFSADWTCVRASDVGACHRRERWFMVAYPDGEQRDGWGGPGSAEGGRGDTEPTRCGQRTVKLLPTPCASETGSTRDLEHRKQAGSQMERSDVVRMLPTPRATDGTKGGPNQRGTSGDLMLPSAVALLSTPRATRGGSSTETVALLPTPLAHGSGCRDAETWFTFRGKTVIDDLNVLAAVNDRWGNYADAIGQHENVLGRPAPPPTEAGSRGQPVLSPRFVEWMMMLPDGWVTDVDGISRNAQLSILGNGVVPAQSTAALEKLETLASNSQERCA